MLYLKLFVAAAFSTLAGLTEAEASSDRYSIGSWDIVQNGKFCHAELSNWRYEVKVVSMDYELFVDVSFGVLSFTSRETWGYTGDAEIYEVSNEAGVSARLPFEDMTGEYLFLASESGGGRGSFADVNTFMRIVATGSVLNLSRDFVDEDGRTKKNIMSIEHEGGAAAMQIIASCGR